MRASTPATIALAGLLAACAGAPPSAPPFDSGNPDPAPFSTAATGEMLPAGWHRYRLMRLKRTTDFRLVEEDGTVALRAIADNSASGVQYATHVSLEEFPLLQWRWKIPAPVDGVRNSLEQIQDSPARIIITFEGGRDDLSPAEQMNYDLALAITGNPLPYATLMYVWENRLPEGAIVTHHFSSRVKMVVIGGGAGPGKWTEETRNMLDDFRRAFSEEPPRVKSIGIMSDTDNSGAHATAFFGDLHFRRAR